MERDDKPLLAVQDMAEGLGKLLGLASALAGSGRRVDLAGLDQTIGRFCAQTLDLGPEAKALRPVLFGLVGQIERLRASLAPAE